MNDKAEYERRMSWRSTPLSKLSRGFQNLVRGGGTLGGSWVDAGWDPGKSVNAVSGSLLLAAAVLQESGTYSVVLCR